jgi:hypothetical protein
LDLDVSGVTGGWSLAGAQTLAGTGTISGNAVINGSIAPGTSGIGTIGFGNDLTLASGAIASFEVDADTITNRDRATVVSTLTYGGTLRITATGTLSAGDSWDIFDFGTQTGTFANNASFGTNGSLDPDLPDLGTGLVWQFDYSTGTLSVAGSGNDYADWAGPSGYNLSQGATGDDDGDGLTNFEEYAFGLNPTDPSSVSPLTPPDKTAGTFTYTRRKPTLSGLTFSYHSSSTLTGAWPAFTPPAPDATNNGNPVETITVTIPSDLLDDPSLFLRVHATQP